MIGSGQDSAARPSLPRTVLAEWVSTRRCLSAAMMVSSQGLHWIQEVRQVGNHQSVVLRMKYQCGPKTELGVPQFPSNCPVRTSCRNRIETSPDPINVASGTPLLDHSRN